MKSQGFITGLLFSTLIVVSFAAQAQSVAKAGHQCSSDIGFSSVAFHCYNPDATDDVRLSVYEDQDCGSDGNITSVDQSNFGIVFTAPGQSDDNTEVKVKYDSQRTHFDDRDGDATMILPVAAQIKTAAATYKIQMTKQTEMDYVGATDGEWHYTGSFKSVSPSGKQLSSGRIECYVPIQ